MSETKPYHVEWATTINGRTDGQWDFHETEQEARDALGQGDRLFRVEWTEEER